MITHKLQMVIIVVAVVILTALAVEMGVIIK